MLLRLMSPAGYTVFAKHHQAGLIMQVEPRAAEEFNTGSFANRKTFYSFKANFL